MSEQSQEHVCPGCGRGFDSKKGVGIHKAYCDEYDNPLDDGSLLLEMYAVKGMSTYEIAEEIGCDRSTLRARMDWYGIERRPLRRGFGLTEETLREMYYEEGMSIREIAEKIGCSDGTVIDRMKEHGIDRRPPSHGKVKGMGERRLREMYYEDGMSIREISEEYECGKTTVYKRMVKHGIERRSPRGGSARYHTASDTPEVGPSA